MSNAAEELRAKVVTTVVRSIVVLTFLLYALVGFLLLLQREVPEALWLAAGNASGALFALLVNSKQAEPPVVPRRPAP